MLRISTIICTYNRANLIHNAIETACEALSHVGSNRCEVLIVDNNSTDDTKKIINILQNSYPFLHYLVETKQGLSYARNKGIREANGDIIAFLDDDVKVDKNWATNLANYFNDPKVMCVGGRILPWWESPPPKWLDDSYFEMLALLDLGDSSIVLDRPHLWGANLAFRKKVFDQYGYFDPHIGRTGKKLLSGEETKIIQTLLQNNQVVYYAPDAVLHHFVPNERMTPRYLIKYSFHLCESSVWIYDYPCKRTFLNVPLYFYREIIDAFIKYIASKFAFLNLLHFLEKLGSIYGFSQKTKSHNSHYQQSPLID
jgi:glycosyltransferase involved in cell wall biosynthesis